MKKTISFLSCILIFVGCVHQNITPKSPQNTDGFPLAEMVAKRDGTNFIGVYLGMIAVHDEKGGVQMYSANRGNLIKWIHYKEFEDIFIKKTCPETKRKRPTG